jgi:hypothetical protein
VTLAPPLLGSSGPKTARDAEIAFSQAAQTAGEWATGINVRVRNGFGASGGETLRWHVAARNDRTLSVEVRDGARYTRVIADVVVAPR